MELKISLKDKESEVRRLGSQLQTAKDELGATKDELEVLRHKLKTAKVYGKNKINKQTR